MPQPSLLGTRTPIDPSRLKGVIFDFDGTLADTLPICIEGFRRAAFPYRGRLLSDQEIRATFGPSEEGSAEALAPGHAAECLDSYYAHYRDLHASCRSPFNGVHNLVRRLKASGVLIGIVTGKGIGSLSISLATVGLEGLFDTLEAGCKHGPCKPEGIQKILSLWAVSADEVIYVGDAPSDVKAARLVGTPVVGAGWGAGDHLQELIQAGPDLLLSSVDELALLLAPLTQHL
jgi:phosphoglycolate phosphatase-like HAD superfamily hydrolase